MTNEPAPEATNANDAPGATPERPFIALVLQGGGALGAYHVGAYRALSEAGMQPDWVTGISIGSINAALIAGNRPAERLSRLEEFWKLVGDPAIFEAFWPNSLLQLYNTGSALQSLLFGQPNFSRPYFINPYLAPAGSPAATGFYDNSPLRQTIARLTSLHLINSARPRLSLGVTRVRTGNLIYFDTTNPDTMPFTLDHILSSAAIPPLYPGVRINGELYWDGGVVDNTPLEPVLDDQAANPARHTLVFMVDLWGNTEQEPRTLDEVMWRYNQIQFASRTDRHIREVVERENLKRALSQMARQVPPDVQGGLPVLPDGSFYTYGNLDIVRITYTPSSNQTALSYLDFSHSSIEERKAEGYVDMRDALNESPWQYDDPAEVQTRSRKQAGAAPRAAMHTVARHHVTSATPGKGTQPKNQN